MNIENLKEYTKIYIDSLLYSTPFRDEAYRQEQLTKIEDAKNLFLCMYIINKGNRFDYLNFLHKYKVITDQECADAVYNIWTTQERFHDCGMTKTKLIKFMKMADKEISLPDNIELLSDNDMVTIYRGVRINDYKGLSWTVDKQRAEWFAKRFGINGENGYVFTGQIKKKDIIAFFDSRNEVEIVCDYRKVKDIQCEEIIIADSPESKFDKYVKDTILCGA
ncbi:MAG: hypothetical protein IKW30_04480 [Lachnospiraceae bacterium]|nr:hypothetical protein [Lachnospiraceae bacterium]